MKVLGSNLDEKNPVFVALVVNVFQSLQHFGRVDVPLFD